MTARCLSYRAKIFAEPTSLKLTRLASDINFPVVSERTKILLKLSLFFLEKLLQNSIDRVKSILLFYKPTLKIEQGVKV